MHKAGAQHTPLVHRLLLLSTVWGSPPSPLPCLAAQLGMGMRLRQRPTPVCSNILPTPWRQPPPLLHAPAAAAYVSQEQRGIRLQRRQR